MIKVIYRRIFQLALLVLALMLSGLFILPFLPGRLDDNNSLIIKVYSIVLLLSPLAVIATLFGTLKEQQTPDRKMLILVSTVGGAIFLWFMIYAVILSIALD